MPVLQFFSDGYNISYSIYLCDFNAIYGVFYIVYDIDIRTGESAFRLKWLILLPYFSGDCSRESVTHLPIGLHMPIQIKSPRAFARRLLDLVYWCLIRRRFRRIFGGGGLRGGRVFLRAAVRFFQIHRRWRCRLRRACRFAQNSAQYKAVLRERRV
jgi:hypothetical protein